MNQLRKMLLIVYLTFVLLACVYVPWSMHFRGQTLFNGYSFIWNPPNERLSGIDEGRLFSEIGIVSALFGIGWVLLPKGTNNKP